MNGKYVYYIVYRWFSDGGNGVGSCIVTGNRIKHEKYLGKVRDAIVAEYNFRNAIIINYQLIRKIPWWERIGGN